MGRNSAKSPLAALFCSQVGYGFARFRHPCVRVHFYRVADSATASNKIIRKWPQKALTYRKNQSKRKRLMAISTARGWDEPSHLTGFVSCPFVGDVCHRELFIFKSENQGFWQAAIHLASGAENFSHKESNS